VSHDKKLERNVKSEKETVNFHKKEKDFITEKVVSARISPCWVMNCVHSNDI